MGHKHVNSLTESRVCQFEALQTSKAFNICFDQKKTLLFMSRVVEIVFLIFKSGN